MNEPAPDVRLEELAELTGPLPAQSHRRRMGGMVVGLKQLALDLVRRALSPLIERQERFNRRVAAQLAELGSSRRSSGSNGDELAGESLHARRLEVVHESLHRELVTREAAVLRTLRNEIGVKTSQALAALFAEAAGNGSLADALGDHLYREFVARFRGSEEEIRDRLELYAELFAGSAPVLDVGCGRGEFLQVLRDRCIEARGVDVNAELVEQCVAQGLAVSRGDGLETLRAASAGSVGGIFCAQVIEHLEPAGIQAFLALSVRALRPGGLLVAETVNAESLSAVARNYFADWTHRTPIAPRSLKFLAERCGFAEPEIRYLSPVPETAKLRIVPVDPDLPTATRDRLEALNRNFELLNALLFGPQDFALVARKSAP